MNQSMAQDEVLLSVAVYKLQLAIYEFGIQDENQFFAVRSLFSKSDYRDVVNERSYIKLCGYPLCNNTLTLPRKGRYHIVLSQHDVYDFTIYCSLRCSANSQAFAKNNLQDKRGSDLSKYFNLFGRKTRGGLEEEEDEGKNCVLGLSSNKLQIHEKVEEDPKTDIWEMSLIGPSNAIEGYVPLRDRIPKVVLPLPLPLIKTKKNHKEEEGSNKSQSSSSRLKKKKKKKKVSGKEAKIVDGMDFMSTSIIAGNQFFSPKMPFDQRQIFVESKFQESKIDQFSILELSSTSDPNVLKTELEEPNGQAGNEVVEIQIRIPETRSSSRSDSDGGILTVTESNGGEVCVVGEIAQLKDISLKSSLKSSLGTKKKLDCTVSWADDENQSCPASHGGGNLCDVQEMSNTIAETSGSSNVEDVVDSSLRFASAEACADALRQAVDSVAPGELDVMDAVSEAGISILPQPQFINGGDSRIDESGTNIYPQPQYIIEGQDELEPERLPLKWPMKTGTLDLELFDSENSWYDTPPEGFSLSLSPFATMWMSLFGWITSSSLAYIYGSEESSEQEFLLVNGREYPRKIVLGGGRSSEIMNTLSGCLTRSLPKLVKDLRISIPISVLDKGMGCLLDTMTFMDALPPFGMKQWHVIILLFLDALSVCRILGLTPYMTSSRMLQHKVLNDAQINVEEYGVMKDLLIPLGRAPLCGRLEKVVESPLVLCGVMNE